MATFADLFAQRSSLLVHGWTALHDYSADLVAGYPSWGTGAGGNVMQFLIPQGTSDVFFTQVQTGQASGASEPDWPSAPNLGDGIGGDGDYTWLNCGPLTGFGSAHPWRALTAYYGPLPAPHTVPVLITESTENGHVYLLYPFNFGTSGSVEPSFPTDGSVTDEDPLFWLDMGEVIPSPTTRVTVAFDAGPLDAFPVWTSLDQIDNLISGSTIERGKSDDFERTGTGIAAIGFSDKDGILDPTNTGGPYFNAGKFIDGKQVAISLRNPVTDEWSTLFRGTIDDVPQDVEPSQIANIGTIECVDGLDYLAGCELRPGVDGDFSPPHEGDVYYGPTTITTVKFRIDQVLTDFDWPAERRNVKTGNVRLQGHAYAPGTPALNVIDDACDAEFPGIANRFITKEGDFRFDGRLARFDALTDPQFQIRQWKAGDGDAIAGNSTYAQIRSLKYGRPSDAVINHALFTPKGIADADIPDCLVIDPGFDPAVDRRRTKSVQDLHILEDVLTGNNAKDQCFEFGSYWVASRKDQKTRITEISFQSVHPDDPRAFRVWDLLCNIEISDVVILKANTSQGGFDDEYHFVEGIRYEILPMTPAWDFVTLTIQVTPMTDFEYAWA